MFLLHRERGGSRIPHSKSLEQGEFNFSGPVDARAELIIGTLIGTRQLSGINGRKTLVRSISLIKSELDGKIDFSRITT